MDSTTQIGFARRSRDRPFTLYGNSTHLTLRRHFTFHQQRFNLSYPSRQFPIPLKVTIAPEIFTHNITNHISFIAGRRNFLRSLI
jgi:hypothetical protein